MFKVRYRRGPGEHARLLHGPGDLTGLYGGELLVIGEPEPQFEAGNWSSAISLFIMRGGSVRRVL